jgi:hypothetical protein
MKPQSASKYLDRKKLEAKLQEKYGKSLDFQITVTGLQDVTIESRLILLDQHARIHVDGSRRQRKVEQCESTSTALCCGQECLLPQTLV